MAYDEEFAERVRGELTDHADFDEKKMFGGLAFMVNTHMACGIVSSDLMVRVGKQRYEAALADGAREMEFTGRPMRGMVMVDGDRVQTPEQLERWVRIAAEFALSEPPKPARATWRR